MSTVEHHLKASNTESFFSFLFKRNQLFNSKLGIFPTSILELQIPQSMKTSIKMKVQVWVKYVDCQVQ